MVGNNILKSNNLLKGSRNSGGHPSSWDLRPGKIIEYDGVRRILVEVKHNLVNNTADLVFLTLDTGIEGVLLGIAEGSQNIGSSPSVVEQITETNFSLFGEIKIVTIPIITIQGHGDSGFVIGKAMNRGTLGATSTQETIGGSKNTPVRSE